MNDLQERNEYLCRFRILKDQYNDPKLHSFGVNDMSVEEMKSVYETFVRSKYDEQEKLEKQKQGMVGWYTMVIIYHLEQTYNFPEKVRFFKNL
jgi:hypothetical protein